MQQQQQQQQQQMAPAMGGAMPPLVISTEQIQKYLDENKQLILAILDNQNLGKLAECAQYQAQLQKNLLYLAAIADSQPPTAVRPQVMPHAGMHPASGQLMQQQSPMYRSPAPSQFNNPQEGQDPHHHPQMMPFPGHMGMRPMGMNAPSMYAHGGQDMSRGSTPSSSSKQDASKDPAKSDGQKNTDASAEADPSSTSKRPEGAKTP